jgi:hypothetical protein
MTKNEAERLYHVLDWISEQLEDFRDEIQADPKLPAGPALDKIVDRLGLVCDALGEAGWTVRGAYQLPELMD